MNVEEDLGGGLGASMFSGGAWLDYPHVQWTGEASLTIISLQQ